MVTFLKSKPILQEKLIIQKDKKTEGARNTRYLIGGYKYLRDQYGAPDITLPWGTLSAIDLKKGETLWQVPLGEYPELVA